MNGDAQIIFDKISELESRVSVLEAQTEDRHASNLLALEKIDRSIELIFTKLDPLKNDAVKDANSYSNRLVTSIGIGATMVVGIVVLIFKIKGG